MLKTAIHKLNEFGQSVWIDNINRHMLKSGRLKEMIGLGLRGMTSNPTIFEKAIISGSDYDEEIDKLHRQGSSTFEIYDALTTKDVQDAADIFLPVYKKTRGLDGYVSLEINPALAYKTDETIKEGKRLFGKVNRPNVMFKVPATDEGSRAIEELAASGININATLIFSVGQYAKAALAYLNGMKRLLEYKKDAGRVHSVASVFVSRIDTVVDNLLDKLPDKSLKGRAAVSNSALIYKKYLEIFSSRDFIELKNKGVNIQRVLWGSTSTKNPNYSDVKYVEELIAKNSVNTMPEQTIDAFLDHGKVQEALTSNIFSAQGSLNTLKKSGIDIDAICGTLLKDGVAAFEKSFDSLLSSLEKKKHYEKSVS